ncbi:MAG: hypothetical protein HXS41_08710 [Theionarchaea archaeon]|nr:hypothetical protein [Theionarchaea archaeon]MBU7000932.1 hypothetical protein [Theionarchaea archaeon]MBU7021127.1 hypothetical protein [Theionarchaea archaeon]MBU7033853.1 hypothetical protein [Theionarchaea archaeon]MBU7039879.1 hypothetical protein [Theionarchaea archaeon]
MKATAHAHPVQTWIGPLPLATPGAHIPFLGSISVCTAPLETMVTVEFQEEREARDIIFEGRAVTRKVRRGVDAVISHVKRLSGIESECSVLGKSNLPMDTTLDEPSFIAAVAAASAEACGLDLSHKELSRIASKGSESAPGAVVGWVSKWTAGLQEEFSHSVVIEEELEIGMVRVFVDLFMSDFEIAKSPLAEARLKTCRTGVIEMERAIRNHDIEGIGELAEKDSLLLHAAAAGSDQVLWSPDVLRVLREVTVLREEGVTAYFNADWIGLYINSYPEDRETIEQRIRDMGVETCSLHVGRNARLLKD